MRSGRRHRALVFGETSEAPFQPKALTERADEAWEAAKLERVTLHDCRHTYASFAIAAGVNAKALSEYMGHASISITMDRYGAPHAGQRERGGWPSRRVPQSDSSRGVGTSGIAWCVAVSAMLEIAVRNLSASWGTIEST